MSGFIREQAEFGVAGGFPEHFFPASDEPWREVFDITDDGRAELHISGLLN